MVTRRDLLKYAGASAALMPMLNIPNAQAVCSPDLTAPTAPADPPEPPATGYKHGNTKFEWDPAPFSTGVASGDPDATSVILWTRLAPDPTAIGGGIYINTTVGWEIATDVGFSSVVQSGSSPALVVDGHSVHVTVNNLSPNTYYYYRFSYAGQYSRIGRTKTFPVGPVSRARFAFISCQKINVGEYAAFKNMLAHNLDFVVHLGDYIYETSSSSAWPTNLQKNPVDLASYRGRYMLYRGDRNLRKLHARVPWIMTWDDHEFKNNYDANSITAQWRRDSYKAYYESMPLRLPAGLPADFKDLRIYRGFKYGDLIDMMVLDTRQYRSDPPKCNTILANGVTVPEAGITVGGGSCFTTDRYAPARSMLGATQKQWLKNSLSASSASWKTIANQQIMADTLTALLPAPAATTLAADPALGSEGTWQGYAAERKEIMDHIAANGIGNVVVLSGDAHISLVAHLKQDFQMPASPVVATEFAGPSVTSANYMVNDPTASATVDNPTLQKEADKVMQGVAYASWRHVRFYQPSKHGYVLCDVTPSQWKSRYMLIPDSQVYSPTACHVLEMEFTVDSGNPVPRMTAGAEFANPLPDV